MRYPVIRTRHAAQIHPIHVYILSSQWVQNTSSSTAKTTQTRPTRGNFGSVHRPRVDQHTTLVVTTSRNSLPIAWATHPVPVIDTRPTGLVLADDAVGGARRRTRRFRRFPSADEPSRSQRRRADQSLVGFLSLGCPRNVAGMPRRYTTETVSSTTHLAGGGGPRSSSGGHPRGMPSRVKPTGYGPVGLVCAHNVEVPDGQLSEPARARAQVRIEASSLRQAGVVRCS